MNKLLLILILTFSFQSLTKADDIRDFQIEGMSIADSLLDYYSEKEIKKAKKNKYKSNEFITIYVRKKNFATYDLVLVSVKTLDKNYEIYSISGIIDFKKNINDCYDKLSSISKFIEDIFPNKSIGHRETSHPVDKSGKSKLTQKYITLEDGYITANCTDYSKEFEKIDSRQDFLMVSVKNKYFMNFLSSKAYK
tara:strand:- start:1135 stop:1716 length:582 start_codon:yes stop_codon:yes gene_type:complete